MPSYKLPPIKDSDAPEVSSPMDYQRRITIPVNDAIMEKLSIGMDAEVMLTGSIIELRNHEDENDSSRTLTIKIDEVACYPADDEKRYEDFKRGFKRGPKR